MTQDFNYNKVKRYQSRKITKVAKHQNKHMYCKLYAWFNSTCYHLPPPRAYPREFPILFSLGGLFPTPGHAERDNSPPPGLLIDHKYVVLCTKHRLRYWFPFYSKTGRFDKNLNAFLEFLLRRTLHVLCNKNMNTIFEKEN